MHGMAIFLSICIGLLVGLSSIPYDGTDDIINEKRSGLILMIDYETGCEYIQGGFFGTTILRLDSNGKHICRRK